MRLDAESKSVVSASDLNAFSCALLFFTKSATVFPAHVSHEFFGVVGFELSVGDAGGLEESLSVLG